MGTTTATYAYSVTVPPQPVYSPAVSLSTPPPPLMASSCAKDPSCFDANYECNQCCSTGIAKNGANCWDAVYTIARCCAGGSSIETTGSGTSTTTATYAYSVT